MKKKLITTIIILVSSYGVFSQNISNEQWQKIRQEAYLEYIQKGGSVDGFKRNSDEIVNNYYKRIYGVDNSGNVDRKEVLRTKNATGTFYSGHSAIGRYFNGDVYNYQSGLNSQVGYNRGGTFYDRNNNCVGYVNGNTIYNCNRKILATIRNGSVVNELGNLLYRINDNSLISSNGQSISIVDISINSLAAFILFF